MLSFIESVNFTSFVELKDDVTFLDLEQLCQLVTSSRNQARSNQDVFLLQQVDLLSKKIKSLLTDFPNLKSIIKITICLLFDFPPSASIHKLMIQSLKSIFSRDEKLSIKAQFWTIFEEVFFQFVENLELHYNDNFVEFIKTIDIIFDSLRNIIFQLYSETNYFLLKRILSTIVNLNQLIIECMRSGECFSSVANSSEIFAFLSNMFHNQMRLSNLVLLKLSKNTEWNSSDDNFLNKLTLTYRESIQATVLESPFPVGVIIEASLVIVRLFYLRVIFESKPTQDSAKLSHKCYSFLVDYIGEKFDQLQNKFSIALMSAFLLETDRSLSLLQVKLTSNENCRIWNWKQDNLTSLLRHLIDSWPCKTQTQFVYYTGMIYLNWTKYVLESLYDQQNSATDEVKLIIESMVQDIVSFAQAYWSYNSIEQIFESVGNCIKVISLVRDQQTFHKFLVELYSRFYHSKNSLSVYRLLFIIKETIDPEQFEIIFKELIISELSLKTSIEHFLFYSNIPTLDFALDDNQEENHQSLTTYQVSNRTIDLVHVVAIRFNFMFSAHLDQLYDEVKILMKTSNLNLIRHYLLSTLLPKLLQIKLSTTTVQGIFTRLVQDENIFEMDAEIILAIIRLNQQYDLRLFSNEKDFIRSFIKCIALKHFDPEIRLQTLNLLVESKKTTDPISFDHLQLIHKLTVSCTSIQQASARDQLVKVYRKLFTRLENSSRSKLNEQIVVNYCQFLEQLVRHAFDSLELNRYFGSLLIYLEITRLFLTSFQYLPDTTSKTPICEYFCKQPFLILGKDFQNLLSMLEHSFEEIKGMSKDILVIYHRSGLYSLKEDQIEHLEQRSKQLLAVPQPLDVQTGVILYKMVIELKSDHTWESYYIVFTKLLEELQNRVMAIKIDPMKSASIPCYPILSVIRALCGDKFNVHSICGNNPNWMKKWKMLISHILIDCMVACEAVSPIVCNDSPEGHLPMDSSEIQQLYDNEETEQVRQLYVTSQMLLLNGWMTVKESVTILSYLVSTYPKHSDVENLVTCEEALSVTDFLYQNQLNLVHRGAFEQSSYAFNRIIMALWKQNCPQCCDKFEQIMLDIKTHLVACDDASGDVKYKTITRRSAGLPFVIQSILVAEPVTMGQSSHGFKLIETLVDLLEPKQGGKPWQVVHSLNILKALVRDARLTESMAPWTECILKLVIHWFDKSNYSRSLDNAASFAYSIQNSSSMLFSALITRIFGVQRNKADTSRKNRMSSLLFFQSYPSLFSFFQNLLERAAFSTNEVKSYPSSLYPTLITLSRLTPSISENNVFDVTLFLKPLQQIIFQCPDSRLRVLAVRVCVQLLRLSNYLDYFKFLSSQLAEHINRLVRSRQIVAVNTLHGTALFLAELLLQYSCNLQIKSLQLDKLDTTGPEAIKPEQQCFSELSAIYQNLSSVLVPELHFLIPGPIAHCLHLVHSRIFSFSMMTQSEKLLEANHWELLLNLTLGTHSTEHLSIATDEMTASLFLDTLIHLLSLDGEAFCERIYQMVKFDINQSIDGQLLIWSLINELLFIGNDARKEETFLLHRNHVNHDTVFIRQIRELLYTTSKLDKAGILKSSHYEKINCASFYSHLLKSFSSVWLRLVDKQTDVYFSNTFLELLHEIFQMIYNGRKLSVFKDTNAFLCEAGFGQSLKLVFDNLFQSLEIIGNDENAHYSLSLVISVCLHDLPAASFDPQIWLRVSSHVHLLSQNLANTLSRQVALQCLSTCLPIITSQIRLNRIVPDAQIVRQLFGTLFTLLQDNEEFIRQDAAKIVQLLEKSLDTNFDPPDLSRPNWYLSQAVAIMAQLMTTSVWQLGALHLIELTSDLFLEGILGKHECDFSEDSQEINLFDKSKLNIYSDGLLLIDLLIDRIEALVNRRWSGMTTQSSVSPIEHLENTLSSLLLQNDLPSSIIERIASKVKQINMLLAISEKKRSLGSKGTLKFASAFYKLSQAL